MKFAIIPWLVLTASIGTQACSDAKFGGQPSPSTKTAKAPSAAESTGTDASAPNDDSDATVLVGGTKQLAAPDGGALTHCTSSDPTVATVDAATCKVTGVAEGAAKISATTAAGEKTNVTVHVTATPVDGTSETAAVPKPPHIGFGLLVNDLNCTFCHLEVHGAIGSVADVPQFRQDSYGDVFGDWLVSGAFNARAGSNQIDGGIKINGMLREHFTNDGAELPIAAGKVAFPMLDVATLATSVRGSLKSTPVSVGFPATIAKVFPGNLVLTGTAATPITIDRDVLVQGDLIIKGVYTGVGTIYVTGNVYIPANLSAKNGGTFPYPDATNGDNGPADAAAQADLKANKDALGIASASNIFLGDLENYVDILTTYPQALTRGTGLHGTRYPGLYDSALIGDHTTTKLDRAVSKVDQVYSWYPEAKFDVLYETVAPCFTSSSQPRFVAGFVPGSRAVSHVDAFLYSSGAIAGVSRASSWTLNGGMIAAVMHWVSGAGGDTIVANAACPASRINFDYRMRNGLPILEALSPYFAKK